MKPRQLLSRVDSPDCSRFLWKLLLPFLFAKRPRPADKGPPRSLRTRCLHHLHHPNSRARGFVAFANTGAAGADHMRSLYFCSHLRVAWHIAQCSSWRGWSPPMLKVFSTCVASARRERETKIFLSKAHVAQCGKRTYMAFSATSGHAAHFPAAADTACRSAQSKRPARLQLCPPRRIHRKAA